MHMVYKKNYAYVYTKNEGPIGRGATTTRQLIVRRDEGTMGRGNEGEMGRWGDGATTTRQLIR